ncbi:MAG: purine-nucleoside phosphorylase [Clostridia bacterium]|nr:purine-nucleoside phosphorylase [Clostridia bacterium]
MLTAHNSAVAGDFAATVLMPGDPKRSKYIAETYLENARLVNDVRGIQGYTGSYKGTPVSVMASGMGMPSMGIYSYELFAFYDVQNIIRVGSAGSIHPAVALRDLVIGMGASTTSAFARQYNLGGDFSAICSYDLLEACMHCTDTLGLRAKTHVGNILSSDAFYGETPELIQRWSDMGLLAIEMEAAALYMNAAKLGKRALTICTVSDHLLRHEALSSEEREKTFDEMMRLALETAIALEC